MLYDNLLIGTNLGGYIAGTADGILTRGGVPSSSDIVLFNADDLSVVQRTQSMSNGHYLLKGLDTSKKYLLMARDYNKEYEPAAWDYVVPATDKTIAEQQQLWIDMQTM